MIDILSSEQIWKNENGVDRRENKTLREKETIIDKILEEVNRVKISV